MALDVVDITNDTVTGQVDLVKGELTGPADLLATWRRRWEGQPDERIYEHLAAGDWQSGYTALREAGD